MSQVTKRESLYQKWKWKLTGLGIGLAIGLGYLILTGSYYSQLIGYFVYMSFACTLIPLPTPPYVIALGKVFHPGIVAFAGSVANCLAALGEYYFITWFFSKTTLQQRVETNRIFQRFSHYFQRAAFACLIFTGVTPIPFEPFRLAAILIQYNVPKYLLAVFVGRFIRYYLVALIGYFYSIPNQYLIVMVILLIVISVIGVFVKGRTTTHTFNSTKFL